MRFRMVLCSQNDTFMPPQRIQAILALLPASARTMSDIAPSAKQ
jgi:hypothetical protein